MGRSFTPWVVFLWVLLLTAAAARADIFPIDPYLFSYKGERIAVGWEVYPVNETPGQVIVRIGKLDLPTDVLKEGDFRYAFLPLPLCGFGEGVTYEVPGVGHPTPIKNIPCPDTTDAKAAPVRMTFIADTQEDTDLLKQFAQQIEHFDPQAILQGGDMVHYGEFDSLWNLYFRAMNNLQGSRVLFPTMGNHEYWKDPNVPLWRRFFRYAAKDAHYAYDIGPVHVITINSAFWDDMSLIQSQLEWFKKEVAKPARWKVVIMHHPPYSLSVFNTWYYFKKEFELLRTYYVPPMEQNGVHLVLSGHTHLSEIATRNGIQYMVAGTPSGSLGIPVGEDRSVRLSDPTRTVINITADRNQLTADMMRIDGSTLDGIRLTQ